MTEQTTLTTHDGRQIELTDDPDDIDAYATGLTVSLGRKMQPKKYESADPFCSIRAEVRPALAVTDGAAVDALRERAERLRRVVSYDVGTQVKRYREDVNGDQR